MDRPIFVSFSLKNEIQIIRVVHRQDKVPARHALPLPLSRRVPTRDRPQVVNTRDSQPLNLQFHRYLRPPRQDECHKMQDPLRM